jgi:hypothetical protein
MNSRTKAVLSFTILVLLIFGLYFFTNWFSQVTGYALGEDEKVNLAQCLDGKNAIFYVSPTCPKCTQHLELFGDTAVRFLDIVECITPEECSAEGGVPAWRINGEYYYGVKSLGQLQRISECGTGL